MLHSPHLFTGHTAITCFQLCVILKLHSHSSLTVTYVSLPIHMFRVMKPCVCDVKALILTIMFFRIIIWSTEKLTLHEQRAESRSPWSRIPATHSADPHRLASNVAAVPYHLLSSIMRQIKKSKIPNRWISNKFGAHLLKFLFPLVTERLNLTHFVYKTYRVVFVVFW